MLKPPVQMYSILDFAKFPEIVEIGYRHALPIITAWCEQEPQLQKIRCQHQDEVMERLRDPDTGMTRYRSIRKRVYEGLKSARAQVARKTSRSAAGDDPAGGASPGALRKRAVTESSSERRSRSID